MDDQLKLLSGFSSVKTNYLSGLRAIRRMWTFVSPWKFGFAESVILGSTQPFVFPLILSWMLSRTMASVFAGDIRQLALTLVYASLALLIPILIYPRCFYVLYSIFSKASGLARKRMFDHIQDLPVSYIEDRFSGDISSRMTTDLNDATQLFGYPTVGQYNPFSQVLSVVVLVVVLLCTNVPLGLFSILVSSLGLLVTGCLSDPIKQIERKTKETIGAATQDMVDMMAGSTMVRMYGMQKPLFRKYAEKTEHIRGLAMRSVKMRSTLGSAMELHLALCYLVVVGIGLAMASKGLVSMRRLYSSRPCRAVSGNPCHTFRAPFPVCSGILQRRTVSGKCWMPLSRGIGLIGRYRIVRQAMPWKFGMCPFSTGRQPNLSFMI